MLSEHPPKTRATGADARALAAVLASAAGLPREISRDAARVFFETEFTPFAVEAEGFFTGYYEPEVAGSLTPTAEFAVPLLRTPDDLVEDRGRHGARSRSVVPLRAAHRRRLRRTSRPRRDHGPARSPAAAWSWCTSAIPSMPSSSISRGRRASGLGDGRLMRVTYAAKSGHPYTPIGRVLIEAGALLPGDVTMAGIRAWLAAHPDRAPGVMAQNRSYIFFREAPVADPAQGPVAAAKVPLSAGRSLAVDRLQHTFHSPVWVETALPDATPCAG